MRVLLILVTVACTCVLVSATPIDPRRQTRRSFQDFFTKGMEPGEGAVKGYQAEKDRPLPVKGEYNCGDKICKLEPGVVPEGCNGMCQYPIIIGPRPGDVDFDDN